MNVWAITEVIADTFSYKTHAVSRVLALLWAIVVCESIVESNVPVCQ
jgi:hypothetical protein